MQIFCLNRCFKDWFSTRVNYEKYGIGAWEIIPSGLLWVSRSYRTSLEIKRIFPSFTSIRQCSPGLWEEGGQATTPVWLPDHNFHLKLCLRHCTSPVCLPYRTFPLFLLLTLINLVLQYYINSILGMSQS